MWFETEETQILFNFNLCHTGKRSAFREKCDSVPLNCQNYCFNV